MSEIESEKSKKFVKKFREILQKIFRICQKMKISKQICILGYFEFAKIFPNILALLLLWPFRAVFKKADEEKSILLKICITVKSLFLCICIRIHNWNICYEIIFLAYNNIFYIV